MGHREQAGTEGPKQTPMTKVGDTRGWQGLEGTPLPLHAARVKWSWGAGACREAPSTGACHKGGEVLSREKPQWSEVRFLTQGWGWPHLENTGFGFLGLLGFQVPVLLSRPALTPTRPCLRSPQKEESDNILGRVGWGMETYFRELLWIGKFYKTIFFANGDMPSGQ